MKKLSILDVPEFISEYKTNLLVQVCELESFFMSIMIISGEIG